jgi:hypothetical protein
MISDGNTHWMPIQHLFSLIHCIKVYKMIPILAGLTVCSDLNTKQWIQFTHKKCPRHTSILKLVAEKWTQFVANNTELDLASHESYGPENGKNIHKLCISINVSSLSLVCLAQLTAELLIFKEAWPLQNANLQEVVFCFQYVANAGKAMFLSCLTTFYEDIHGTMVVKFHKSRWQIRVSIWSTTLKIIAFWLEIRCSLSDWCECFGSILYFHFQPSLLPWRWKQHVHPKRTSRSWHKSDNWV